MMFFWMLLDPPPIISPTSYSSRYSTWSRHHPRHPRRRFRTAGPRAQAHRPRATTRRKPSIVPPYLTIMRLTPESTPCAASVSRRRSCAFQAITSPCSFSSRSRYSVPQPSSSVRLHQRDELFQPRCHLLGIADHRALVLQRHVGDVPAFAAPHDDLVFGHAHVGEEHLVEFGAAGHGAQRPHLDAGRLIGNSR